MTPQPLDADEIQAFLDELDEAGDQLRELVEEGPPPEGPAVKYYLDGAAFVEAGYTMVEQLGDRFPDVFRAMHAVYAPLFQKTQRGQIGWAEALEGLPGFLSEFAQEKVARDLLGDGEG